ncbi:hypothetical protein D9M68_174750 [compost metagenome]
MLFNCLRIVIEGYDWDTRRLNLFDAFSQRVIRPGSEDHEIGPRGQDLFHRESAVFCVAHIRNRCQLRNRPFVCGELVGPPVLPGREGKSDDFVNCTRPHDGQVVLVVKAENDPLCRLSENHFSSLHIGHLYLGKRPAREQCQGGKCDE